MYTDKKTEGPSHKHGDLNAPIYRYFGERTGKGWRFRNPPPLELLENGWAGPWSACRERGGAEKRGDHRALGIETLRQQVADQGARVQPLPPRVGSPPASPLPESPSSPPQTGATRSPTLPLVSILFGRAPSVREAVDWSALPLASQSAACCRGEAPRGGCERKEDLGDFGRLLRWD